MLGISVGVLLYTCFVLLIGHGVGYSEASKKCRDGYHFNDRRGY